MTTVFIKGHVDEVMLSCGVQKSATNLQCNLSVSEKIITYYMIFFTLHTDIFPEDKKKLRFLQRPVLEFS